MKLNYFGPLLAFALLVRAQAQTPIPLWNDGAPGALGKADHDVPSLTPYLADPVVASGAAMVILPGGGYGGLAPHEGEHYARFFNEHGIAGFVLEYRLGSSGCRHPVMLHDSARALRPVGARAADWTPDPTPVGLIGPSTG